MCIRDRNIGVDADTRCTWDVNGQDLFKVKGTHSATVGAYLNEFKLYSSGSFADLAGSTAKPTIHSNKFHIPIDKYTLVKHPTSDTSSFFMNDQYLIHKNIVPNNRAVLLESGKYRFSNDQSTTDTFNSVFGLNSLDVSGGISTANQVEIITDGEDVNLSNIKSSNNDDVNVKLTATNKSVSNLHSAAIPDNTVLSTPIPYGINGAQALLLRANSVSTELAAVSNTHLTLPTILLV